MTVSGGASSEKSERSRGDLAYFFSLKVYPTNLMPFFFDNFADFWDLGEESPQSPL